MLFFSASNKQALGAQTLSPLVTVEIFEELIRLAPTELTFVSKFRSVLLGDVLASRVLVSAFWHYRVSLQRKKCCQQIIRLDDESFSVAVCVNAKEE